LFSTRQQFYTVDRAGFYTEFAASALSSDDSVHPFGGATDRIDGARLDAERAANTMIFGDHGGGSLARHTTFCIQGNYRVSGEM
jgi:hypothetical protein